MDTANLDSANIRPQRTRPGKRIDFKSLSRVKRLEIERYTKRPQIERAIYANPAI